MTRRQSRFAIATVLIACLVPAACSGKEGSASGATSLPASCPDAVPDRLTPTVVRELPHSTEAFVQGLVIHDGVLYESDGLVGRSKIRAIDPGSGEEIRTKDIDPEAFAEGLAVGEDDRLVQLTWKDGLAYVWTADDFEPAGRFAYQGEGWGLTTLDDGTLIRSDGTDRLTEHDPSDFSVVDDWQVTRTGGSASDLNELEWDGTHVWANHWKTDEILRIDPGCRKVDAVVDASDLADRARALAAATVPPTQIDVMNGVAAIPGTDHFLVTGKFWPVMFEVTFDPA